MAMEMEFADEIHDGGEGNYLNEPGVFHLLIEEVREGVGPNGKAVDGFGVGCKVRAGTVADCAGKTVDLQFFAPNYTSSERAVAATKRQNTAFALAANLIDPNALGTKAAVELTNAEGSQIIVKLARKMDKDPDTGEWTVPSKFLQIAYSDIWHIDDPAAKDHPKDAEAIAVIPKEKRRSAEWFAFKAKTNAASVATKTTSPANDFSNL